MKNKITVFCCGLVAISLCCTVFFVKTDNVKSNITTANAKVYYDDKTESTTGSGGSLSGILGDAVSGLGNGSSGGLGDIIGGIGNGSSGGLGDAVGGLGDSIGGLGDSLGGILGGLGSKEESEPVKTTATTVKYDTGVIIPVPAATQATTQKATETTTEKIDENTGETVDYAATSNPYTKPEKTFAPGDKDETIKWIQWIFIYTQYGLKEDGITGVLDEPTVAVVKKLQHEYGLTVDGNITEDVIKSAEMLYYQKTLNSDATAIEVSLEMTTGEALSYSTGDSAENNNVLVIVLVILIIILWLFAIGGIVALVIMRKKKNAAQKDASSEKSDAKKTEDKKDDDNKEEKADKISSLSDLFEDANKKE